MMPISPQITITPETISTKSFDITAVSFTSSTATYTATGHTFSVGDVVLITEIAPDGYNGNFTITATATNTFTVANTTNAAVTFATGNAFWASATDYDLAAYSASYLTTPTDVNSLIDVNSTVAAATAAAASAATAAGTAQSTANTALANAATAYSAAIASLQPSANTIVNASNQMTAIAANGITVYSGSSPSSGARVVLNSTGLAGFDSGGSATFSISASTGAAVFSGSVTGSTITGGTLNIAGNAIIDSSGLLTATGATITGAINATSGYFGTVSNGFSISSTGLVGVGSGTIVGGVISGTSITTNVGTIAGWTLSSTAFTNSGADTFLYANPGSDGLAYSTIGRGIMRRLQLNGASGTTLGTNVLAVGGTISVDSDATLVGNIRSVGTTNTTTGSAANMFINSVSGLMARSTASSQRYKHDIVNLTDIPELDPKALYELPVRAFRFNKDYLPETDDRAEILVPGFIAEEVDAIYPVGADYNAGQVESWNDRMIVPAMLALIQDQDARIKALEGK
jgi:hypothetical protein